MLLIIVKDIILKASQNFFLPFVPSRLKIGLRVSFLSHLLFQGLVLSYFSLTAPACLLQGYLRIHLHQINQEAVTGKEDKYLYTVLCL